ncbi:MAG: glycosyltransferase [Anaerolineaceae bacterium]|nr:glycosyltransferase [Anaerolineaceae bacterium]
MIKENELKTINRILQINSSDLAGGAERVSYNLHKSYIKKGLHSWLVVGKKHSLDEDIFELDHFKNKNYIARYLKKIARSFEEKQEQVRGAYRIRKLFETLADPYRAFINRRGYEDFNFPGTYDLLNLTPSEPQLVHCHNLHGGYFDLGALPWLSNKLPLVITLHDAWLLSGHCAHSFGCNRWLRGCGQCPDLSIPPSIPRDKTDQNWERKREIFTRSRLFIASPSKWLMDKVKQSMLIGFDYKVIPNGVDLNIFQPKNKLEARKDLQLPMDVSILLFASHMTKSNPWRDYSTLEKAVRLIKNSKPNCKIIFICLGENGKNEKLGDIEIYFLPYQKESVNVAKYYQAADIYLYAAKADTFPNTVIESLACGTPVISTSVGGIPEQIQNGVNGFLVPPRDSYAISSCVERLLSDKELLDSFSFNSAQIAKNLFGLETQVDKYLSWYNEIINEKM